MSKTAKDELVWVGREASEEIAFVRCQCYGTGIGELAKMREWLAGNPMPKDGDFLLMRRGGKTIGTTTSLSYTACIRGAMLPCQGIAWVGAIRTARRIAGGGVATQVMNATLAKARERGQVISMLMPFRVSFYEHFGFGVIERRNEWTIPLSILPRRSQSALRLCEPTELPALDALKQNLQKTGQCDLDRPLPVWERILKQADEGFVVIDRPKSSGPIHSWMELVTKPASGSPRTALVGDCAWDSPQALLRLLDFLSSLKDQYSTAQFPLPMDIPLNHLIQEAQIPRYPVDFPTPACRPYTRMMARILDHKKFIESVPLPKQAHGAIRLTIKEPEGTTTRMLAEWTQGKGTASNKSGQKSTPEFTVQAKTWAAIACGYLQATTALEWGLAEGTPTAAALLDQFSVGPVPWVREYF